MALTAAEREVVISFSEADGEAVVYSASPVFMRKMDRLVLDNPTEFKELTDRRQYVDEQKKIIHSKTYTMPKHLISIRSKSRTYTDEQREMMAERLKAIRNN